MPTNNYQNLKSYGNRILRAGAAIAAAGLASIVMGCGTINSGVNQTIKVESEPSNAEIWSWGKNGKRFEGYTPLDISVPRRGTKSIGLEKKGYCARYYPMSWEFNNESLKNFVFLPFFWVGQTVDLVKGGAYNLLPKNIYAMLEKEKPIAPPKKEINVKNDEEIAKYLKMLKELKDSQAITEEEFNSKRKALVDML